MGTPLTVHVLLHGLHFPRPRIWFWVKDPTDDNVSGFNWDRDSIYLATVLLGAGGATVLVISMARIAYLVGKHTVSVQ